MRYVVHVRIYAGGEGQPSSLPQPLKTLFVLLNLWMARQKLMAAQA